MEAAKGKQPPNGERKGSDPTEEENKEEMKKQQKKYKLDEGEIPSIFADLEQTLKIFGHLPASKLEKLKKNPKVLNTITGPYEPLHPFDPFIPFISAKSVSSYPHIPGKPNRDGDPICDSYHISLQENNTVIAVITDGCNWGRRPLEASHAARDSFIDYLRIHQSEIQVLRDAGHHLLKALSFCHHKICLDKEDIWEAGTTTLLGGLIIKLKKKEDPKAEKEAEDIKPQYCFVFVSIGDCKVFHFSAKSREINDLTLGNRKNVYDLKDCGGRLGPYVGDGAPDLRNVAVDYTMCEENDLILMMSDGVHDNLDPQILGKLPKDIGPEWSSIADWTSFPSEESAEAAKIQFMKKFLGDDVIGGGEEERKQRLKVCSFAAPEDEGMYSPSNITTRLIKHCMEITGKSRQWMEQNPKDKLPNDYVEYPGKMDHTTCVAIKVGNYEQALLKYGREKRISSVIKG